MLNPLPVSVLVSSSHLTKASSPEVSYTVDRRRSFYVQRREDRKGRNEASRAMWQYRRIVWMHSMVTTTQGLSLTEAYILAAGFLYTQPHRIVIARYSQHKCWYFPAEPELPRTRA